MLSFLRERRRRKIAAGPFPPAWERILERRAPLWRRLPEADRAEARGKILVFLAEKSFEGAGGLRVTDDMRVVVAFHAVLLLLHRPAHYYPLLSSVVMYPKPYVGQRRDVADTWIVTDMEEERAGESWREGTVVLSWHDILNGFPGFNVVIHEFVHQLDLDNGEEDGTPGLHPDLAGRWVEVMEREYEALAAAERRGEDPFLDPYGAEHPAEFFAVVTEAFFEQGAELQEHHPDLYEVLTAYFHQDPAAFPP